MSAKEYKEKFIGFVDILGFKNMVKASEAGTGMSLSILRELVNDLGTPSDREWIVSYGPMVCPNSSYIRRDLDIQLSQVTDCVVVSAEVSPAGLINLINHCCGASIKLLTKGIMVRGYITRGTIYHEGNEFFGSGYHKALDGEKGVTAFKHTADERGTPFIEVDQLICDYVTDHGDTCVKEMFPRYVKVDRSGTAIYPFQSLKHSLSIAGLYGLPFDPEKEKEANQNLRKNIIMFKDGVNEFVDTSNPDAVKKAEHYILGLDKQLQICDDFDGFIDKLIS